MLRLLFLNAVHGLTMEQRCSQFNIPMDNCVHRRNLDMLLSSSSYPQRSKQCTKEECMAYYRDECDICDSQECFRKCQGRKSSDKELLEFLRGIAEKSNIRYELDGIRQKGGDVRTVIVDGPAERESIKIVTVSQSAASSVVTITQNETKTVTVEPKHESKTSGSARQEECKDCEKRSQSHCKDTDKKSCLQEASSEDSGSVSPTICINRNECGGMPGSKHSRAKESDKHKEGGGDVTVTRVIEKTTTLEKPLTLYREVTTTITKEKPITNYKVTTFTDTSTRVESVVITKTETRVFSVDGGEDGSSYRSAASQRSLFPRLFPEYEVNKTVRMPSDETNGRMPSAGDRSTVTITRCEGSMDAHTTTHQGVVTITRCEDGMSRSRTVDSTIHVVTVTRDASSVMTVTVTKQPGSVAMPESIMTTTVLASAVSVVTINVPMVSTITMHSMPLVTTVTAMSSNADAAQPCTTAKRKAVLKAVSKGCEIHSDVGRPKTICRFQNVPKELLKGGVQGKERGKAKKRRTVYRTVYSTEGSAGDYEKVVTITKFV